MVPVVQEPLFSKSLSICLARSTAAATRLGDVSTILVTVLVESHWKSAAGVGNTEENVGDGVTSFLARSHGEDQCGKVRVVAPWSIEGTGAVNDNDRVLVGIEDGGDEGVAVVPKVKVVTVTLVVLNRE